MPTNANIIGIVLVQKNDEKSWCLYGMFTDSFLNCE